MSGAALKLMFMDAHLKVFDKREVFYSYLKRRSNIIKVFVGAMDKILAPAVKKLKIDTEITLYVIQDALERMNLPLAANDRKAVISQRTSVGRSGLVKNTAQEYARLEAEGV